MSMNERLRLAREKRGYRYAKDAAAALGINYPTYAGHENGTRGIKRKDVARYAKFFGVTVPWLEHGVGDENIEADAQQSAPKALHPEKGGGVDVEQAVAVVEGALLSAGLNPEFLVELRSLLRECLQEPLVLENPESQTDSRRTLAKSVVSQFLKQHGTLTKP